MPKCISFHPYLCTPVHPIIYPRTRAPLPSQAKWLRPASGCIGCPIPGGRRPTMRCALFRLVHSCTHSFMQKVYIHAFSTLTLIQGYIHALRTHCIYLPLQSYLYPRRGLTATAAAALWALAVRPTDGCTAANSLAAGFPSEFALRDSIARSTVQNGTMILKPYRCIDTAHSSSHTVQSRRAGKARDLPTEQQSHLLHRRRTAEGPPQTLAPNRNLLENGNAWGERWTD